MAGQSEVTIEIMVSDGNVRRCVPIIHSGVALQETYERQLEYIRAHADKLGISECVVEALRTQFCPQPVMDGHTPTHRPGLSLCGTQEFCTQHPTERKA